MGHKHNKPEDFQNLKILYSSPLIDVLMNFLFIILSI